MTRAPKKKSRKSPAAPRKKGARERAAPAASAEPVEPAESAEASASAPAPSEASGPATEAPASNDDPAPADDEIALEAAAMQGHEDALLPHPDLVTEGVNGLSDHAHRAEAETEGEVESEEPATPAEEPEAAADPGEPVEAARELSQTHLEGLLEALVFASDKPVKTNELARLASAPARQVREVMTELRAFHAPRGIVLDEVAGGWLFRTNAQYAPFVRELAGGRPVKLSRAQLETLAIAAYRQPITRPEIDEIRGVDSGATLKLLLERDLLRILGKKDEPGRPLLYGTTAHFLEFFNMKSLKDLPTLREFTELSDESRKVAETELGEVLPDLHIPVDAAEAAPSNEPSPGDVDSDGDRDTIPIASARVPGDDAE